MLREGGGVPSELLPFSSPWACTLEAKLGCLVGAALLVARNQPGRHGPGGESSEALGRAWTGDRKGLG